MRAGDAPVSVEIAEAGIVGFDATQRVFLSHCLSWLWARTCAPGGLLSGPEAALGVYPRLERVLAWDARRRSTELDTHSTVKQS